ncbi:GLPGLI family protein [Flavobacterium coralii]|uniref:GLPGLI family protein n=1 Tax=Flavobacterium coralii TaxID=2838017 RepID=UPI000C416289|nr:GLPGLI family protein [Flavobacterium sp.]
MKNCFVCLLMLAGFALHSQNFRGMAIYESKTMLEMKTGDGKEIDLGEDFKEQLAKAFEKKYTLKFDAQASVYEEQEKLQSPGPVGITVKVTGDGRRYKNLKEKYYLLEGDIFGKEFLVKDSLVKLNWKLENETKKIGSYNCFKATYTIKKDNTKDGLFGTDKDVVVTAWYTPDIPVGHGPGIYWGLPGLILEVNDGSTSLLCSKIVLNPAEKFEITKPSVGQKVSQAEFDKIHEEKMQQMEQMENTGPEGTTRVFRIGG